MGNQLPQRVLDAVSLIGVLIDVLCDAPGQACNGIVVDVMNPQQDLFYPLKRQDLEI